MSRLRDILTVVAGTVCLFASGIQAMADGYYYVDYSGGSDFSVGTNPATAWQHCPGDPSATGVAASYAPQPGDTFYFKGGEAYVITGPYAPQQCHAAPGISLASGTEGAPITYNGSNGWGTGKAQLTDSANGVTSTNSLAAFCSVDSVSNIIITGFTIGPMGGYGTSPPPATWAGYPNGPYGYPANDAWGIFIGSDGTGAASNLTIANCDFSGFGCWQNGPGSSAGSTTSPPGYPYAGNIGACPNPAAAITFLSGVNVTITNCSITKCRSGMELFYGWDSPGIISNLEIVGCDIGNYIVFGIDLESGTAGSWMDDVRIHNNNIHDIGWAYSVNYATNNSFINGGLHQDGIFLRSIQPSGEEPSSFCVYNGTNIDIYDNNFYNTPPYTNGVGTGAIFITDNQSANIYNNLFNVPAENWDAEIDLENDNTTTNSTVRILNNTFLINAPDASYNQAIYMSASPSTGSSQPYVPEYWNAKWVVLNNIFYDFAGPPGYTSGLNIIYDISNITNYPVMNTLTVNYNDYRSTDTNSNGGFYFWQSSTGVPYLGGYQDAQFLLPFIRANLGWESNGFVADPQFVSLAGSATNAIINNYRLQSGSPCIGAGTNLTALGLPGLTVDPNGTTRPASGAWDIGAYEYNTNSVPPSPPVASFSATPTNGTAPLTVTFTDSSTGTITNRFWQFGDGNLTNTMATTMIYQYTVPGTDTVQLIVSGPGGSSTNVRANLVTVSSSGGNTNSVSPPVASFSAAPTNGTAPLTVTFTDSSTGTITNRFWQFGDGNLTNSMATTVTYEYTAPGTNTVQLIVSGPGGSSTNVEANLITVGNTSSVPPSPPVASFGAAPTGGTVPLTVTFTDTSTGTITNRSWQFGDGNVLNTMATTVIYQYTAPGTDTVQLIVSGPGGSSTNVEANLITVGNTNSVSPPVAAFSAAPTSGTAPLTVTFTDTSTGSITNRLWHFGDGTSANTSGTTMVHQYTGAGTNSVKLVVSGPGGTGVDMQGNLIIVNTNSQSGGGTNGVTQVRGHYHWRFLTTY
jgi:PKD repeat protein